MTHYDVIVIGGGPAGTALAYGVAASKKVLVIEHNLWGGTCPNFGCDPKKMLYSAIEARDWTKRLAGHGLTGTPSVDWPALMAFKRSYTSTVPDGTKSGLQAAGIDTVEGQPAFSDAHTLTLNGATYTADDIVIATGREPAFPQVPGKELLGTSTDFLALDEMPASVAFIGAGFVSLEFANMAAAAGAEVHVVNHSARALRAFPEEDTQALRQLLEQNGVQFHDNVSVTGVTATADGQVTLQAADFKLTVSRAFTAMGRVPAIDLDLAAAGVQVSRAGVTVDDHLQTNIPHIYAIGDVVAKTQPKLTPVAGFEGEYLAGHLLGDPAPIAYPAQPEVVFSATKLAQVGISLDTAQADPTRYAIKHNDVTHWYTYNRMQERHAEVTTIIDQQTDQLAGAVVLSASADELINYITLLMNAKVTATKAKAAIYAYPSVASDLTYLI